MKITLACLIVAGLAPAAVASCNETKVTDNTGYSLIREVDPFIGTGAHGHTYPGATLPFGMVQLSPDTFNKGWDWCSGYHYTDRSIMGFSHTHLSGTGSSDYGDFLFMPTTGELKFKPGSRKSPDAGYRSRFSHDCEVAYPGFYSVHLDDYDVEVQLTATRRVGLHRYQYPATTNANVIIDLAHFIDNTRILSSGVEFLSDRKLRGYVRKQGWAANRRLHFVAEFNRPFADWGLQAAGKQFPKEKAIEGTSVKAYVVFDTTDDPNVVAKVALSAVDYKGAQQNLNVECGDLSFDQIQDKAMATWESQLAKIRVAGGSQALRRIFYTSLYHSCLTPNISSDVDGRYRGMDREIHAAEGYEQYTVFSLWDTFRALHPLMTLIERDRTNDFIKSMLAMYQQSGRLPKWELASNETWAMIGYHAVSVIADAWSKDIRDYDPEQALEAMYATSMQDYPEMRSYRRMGYVAMDHAGRSASRTVEYAYDDWCIARMAEAIGRDELRSIYDHRSQFYRNVFDEESRFIRGRNSTGQWQPNFQPDAITGEFVEGNSWHYSWFAPHDIRGLIGLMGGDENFSEKLDELFSRQGREHMDVSGLIGQYAHGNEPSHNFAYLYSYAGQAWKTQQRVSQITHDLYSDMPDGVCGNEDCGQMSAWFVFSAMGFYPVCPGQPMYAIGSPAFPSVEIDLGEGESFVVAAANVSRESLYIQSTTLNGKPYGSSFLTHADLMEGGKLSIEMGPEPNKQWASNANNRPPSPLVADLPGKPRMRGVGKLMKQVTGKAGATTYIGQIEVLQTGLLTFRQRSELGRFTAYFGEKCVSHQPTTAGSVKAGVYPIRIECLYPMVGDNNEIAVLNSDSGKFQPLETLLVPTEKWLPELELSQLDPDAIFLEPEKLEHVSLATGKSVTCSGNTQYPNKPSNIVDADVTNRSGWHCSTSPSWIEVDLGHPHSIDKTNLYTYQDGSRVYRYTIEVSLDGDSYTEVVDYSDNKTPSTLKPFRHNFEPVQARFVRVHILSNSANSGVHLNELQVFEKADAK